MFLVVFRNRKRADLDQVAYDGQADQMEVLARARRGFRSYKTYRADDGEVIAVSEWDDEDAARSWGAQADHRVVQQRGREIYYESYTLFACADPRIHRFDRSQP